MADVKVKDTKDYGAWQIPADGDPLPNGDKVICLSKYGIASMGKFIPTFHVAWCPMPKIGQRLRQHLTRCGTLECHHVGEEQDGC